VNISFGVYTVKLTVTNIHSCQTGITKTNLIKVAGPTANFSASSIAGCKPLNISFTDRSIPDANHPIKKWLWVYDDGTKETLSGPPFSHIFNTADSFSTKLT